MPLVRCRYYTESGEPIRGGCRRKGAGCNFIHPDESDWISAQLPRDRNNGGSGGFKSWGEQNKRGSTASAPDISASGGWGAGGGWDMGGGWSSGSGFATGGSISTSNQDPERPQRKNSSATGSWSISTSAPGWNLADTNGTPSGNATRNKSGLGEKTSTPTGSGWRDGGNEGWGKPSWGDDATTPGSGHGSSENAQWGGPSWGSTKNSNRTTGPVSASTQDGGWGESSWGATEDAGKTMGSASASTPAWGGSSWGAKDVDKGSGLASAQDGGWGGSSWGGTKGLDKSRPSSKQDSGWSGSGWGGTKDTDKTTGPRPASGQDSGWGGSSWGCTEDVDKTTRSETASGQDGGRGGSSWGSTKDVEKTTGSGPASKQDGGWGGSSWGGTKDAEKTTEFGTATTQDGGWGVFSEGPPKNATNSGGFDAMVLDGQAEKNIQQDRGKGKVVPPPPRIRIPDNESRKGKITGTNNEPLGTNRWGSNPPATSASVTASTPVATSTPTESTRVKRKRDAAFEEKLDVFKEYIKAWERAVRAQFLLAEAEAKRNRWFRTQKSLCYVRVGEAGRNKLDAQRTECDKEVNIQREKLSAAITSLINFHDIISSQLDLGQRYNVSQETRTFVAESKAFVDEARALLVTHILKSKNDLQPGDAQNHPGTTLINSLKTQVQDMEERFDQAMTELTLRHQRDIHSEIDELLTTKISGLRLVRQHEVDRAVSQRRQDIVIPPPSLENMEATAQLARETNAKIPHTVEDIRVLLLRVDATTKRVSQLEEELTINKKAYEKQMQEKTAEKEETERRVEERLAQIRVQFEELVASRPADPAAQPAVSPDTNSREKLIEILRPSFEANLNKLYEQEIRPSMESMQKTVIAASDRHHQEAVKVLWGKMQPAMNMVAGVSRWLDSQELGMTAPVSDG